MIFWLFNTNSNGRSFRSFSLRTFTVILHHIMATWLHLDSEKVKRAHKKPKIRARAKKSAVPIEVLGQLALLLLLKPLNCIILKIYLDVFLTASDAVIAVLLIDITQEEWMFFMDLRFRNWTYIQTSFQLKNRHATSSSHARCVETVSNNSFITIYVVLSSLPYARKYASFCHQGL